MVGNWNACLMAAKGEFVKMMGQDDLLETNCLKKQVEALQENPAANLCVSAANLYSARSARLFPKRRHWSEGWHSGNERKALSLNNALEVLKRVACTKPVSE